MLIRDTVLPLVTSRTLTYVMALALGVGLYALLPVWKENSGYHPIGDIPSQFHAALSLVLGWLLVFRTNAAYGRWWEARTLWGGLVNVSRNLSVKCAALVQMPNSAKETFRSSIKAFPIALRDHLRGMECSASIPDCDYSNVRHVPSEIVRRMYKTLQNLKQEGVVDGNELRILDLDLTKFLEICGACERIQNTRVVQSYRIFARQCVILFLASLPWGIVHDFNWWTVPLTIITAYFMLGLEIVAEHVEEPFGLDDDDLDLDGMCKTIEFSVDEIFAHAPSLPAAS
jgi:ion channel-forming bestrophin family protein